MCSAARTPTRTSTISFACRISESQSEKCEARAITAATAVASATALDAEAPSDQEQIGTAAAEFRRLCDGGDEHELAADEEDDRDDVQGKNDRPGLHQPRGSASSVPAGKLAGWTRRSRSSQRAASAVGTSSPRSTAASAAA